VEDEDVALIGPILERNRVRCAVAPKCTIRRTMIDIGDGYLFARCLILDAPLDGVDEESSLKTHRAEMRLGERPG
jgi:hypothetical protein